MSRDIDDLLKEVIKNDKELNKADDRLAKEISLLDKDIQNLKKDVKTLSAKIDEILDILNTLTIFIEDAEHILDEEDEEEYQSNEGWLPEVSDWEDNYAEEDDEDQ